MSSLQGKRKVMGRIDLTNATESPSAPSVRAYAHVSNAASPSPSPVSTNVRKAKVNPSSIVHSTGTGVTAKVSNAQPGTRAHVASAPISSPTVRSPLNGLANYNSVSASGNSNGNLASPSPALHNGAIRVTNVVGFDSRQSTRSPSPSGHSNRSGTLSPVLVSGQAPYVSTQQRAKARPVSTYGQDVVWSSASPRAAPVSLSAKVTSAMNDTKPVRAHLRTQSSFSSASGPVAARGGSASPLSSAPKNRSRSPSPTFVKLHQQPLRRISHGSTASLGGSSTVTSSSITSATKPYSVGAATAAASANATLNRPALASTSYFPGTPSPTLLQPTLGSGLDSPVQLQSPTTVGDAHPLASPTAGNVPLSSPNALLSPGVELDAEAIEAKTNRKILDLEITNRSLLAINSSLEVVKLQQAREIRDLKRHVREGRALGNRLGLASETSIDLEDSSDCDEDVAEDSDSDGSDVELPLNTELEQAHQRCNLLINEMVTQAREAILSKYDTERRTAGNRVLHPAEVDAMRQAAEERGVQSEAQEGTPIAGTIELEADEEEGKHA